MQAKGFLGGRSCCRYQSEEDRRCSLGQDRLSFVASGHMMIHHEDGNCICYPQPTSVIPPPVILHAIKGHTLEMAHSLMMINAESFLWICKKLSGE